jgi:4'-phosphopantetheinyl transferase
MITLWLVDLEAAVGTEVELSEGERQKAARFRAERDRRNYSSSHRALRKILSGYLGGDLERVLLVERCVVCGGSGHGKPELMGGIPINFSLSHTGGRAAIAVAAGHVAVGVDIERADRLDEPGRFHPSWDRQVLSDHERSVVDRGGAQDNWIRLAVWTRKEAVLKCLGVGLSHPLGTFSVVRNVEELTGTDPRVVEIAGKRLSVCTLAPDDGTICSVAFGGEWPDLEVRVYEDSATIR